MADVMFLISMNAFKNIVFLITNTILTPLTKYYFSNGLKNMKTFLNKEFAVQFVMFSLNILSV